MSPLFDVTAPKKPTNVSINSDLLQRARRLGINLSATFESALTERVRTAQQEQWRRENVAAIRAYNRTVEEHGTFGDGERQF
ncbi:type II toxin-antitoxin system CcdA family antitoxin [Halomonas rhizosphaerae]|uniref:Type II toxin-antitoxin system CcdA family antitoxin n=1 Tax=Halomonas rhizosphaerae TaxID=3043296 RepID=A0ABT6V284_9GAMM|nr:type II toxin-antitoxin system CcdA family antitoxin [Halomonas rhizosphaerae]MDI5892329.1 type II toxin-antitoxin system CcdA family antitoxin [Halomonas rhizosphaerae]MDI5920040.1 type II toxin-antitoxin system CcdA family antitoxin [Halomonas rhizosphaerae]